METLTYGDRGYPVNEYHPKLRKDVEELIPVTKCSQELFAVGWTSNGSRRIGYWGAKRYWGGYGNDYEGALSLSCGYGSYQQLRSTCSRKLQSSTQSLVLLPACNSSAHHDCRAQERASLNTKYEQKKPLWRCIGVAWGTIQRVRWRNSRTLKKTFGLVRSPGGKFVCAEENLKKLADKHSEGEIDWEERINVDFQQFRVSVFCRCKKISHSMWGIAWCLSV